MIPTLDAAERAFQILVMTTTYSFKVQPWACGAPSVLGVGSGYKKGCDRGNPLVKYERVSVLHGCGRKRVKTCKRTHHTLVDSKMLNRGIFFSDII